MSSWVPPGPQLVAFLIVAGLLTITPGADMALVMRHALGRSTRRAFCATLGICVGCLMWGTASALGVAALLARSALAFTVLKSVGGAYLLYLGLRAIGASIRAGHRSPDAHDSLTAGDDRRIGLSRAACFVQGLLTNLLNPKVAVFYVTFLPQFVAPDRPVLPQSVFLATTHVLMGLLWLSVYARFVARVAAVLCTERVRRRLEAVTGTVLVALGLRLAMARR